MADIRKGGLRHDDVLGQATAWKAAGKGVALATVVTTWGSSPRPVGSQMAIDDSGNMVGSVSGGCIEGAVVTESRNVIDNGTPQLLDFGVSNDMAWEVGLACGGKVEVYVERVDEPMYAGALKKALAAREAKAPLAIVTRFPDGLRAIVTPAETEGDLELSAATLAIVRQRLTDDRSGRLELAEGDLFVLVLNPPKRLVVVGAVHISQSLVPMAQLAGYEVTIVDPRGAFATEDRFPGVRLTDAWPDEALEHLAPDHRTAVVTLTHDPKLDDPALSVALRSEVFYIGALGSKKTHNARSLRLEKAGFSEAEIARIAGPVGLAIGAKSPAEIAVSILAQMTQALHRSAT